MRLASFSNYSAVNSPGLKPCPEGKPYRSKPEKLAAGQLA